MGGGGWVQRAQTLVIQKGYMRPAHDVQKALWLFAVAVKKYAQDHVSVLPYYLHIIYISIGMDHQTSHP